ncbi:TCDD-inducible poly [ADP-ribose] [Lates japonicus]|uniref:TCDD-inducible poly [ADP-ribose] n=1 Tax=Lates japonicus TaxID=270547 RepID=A0AAD3NP06_LATJO|nr:TCDD-inducible poly [ADP-ribose] [Lates japonicus]
MQLLPIATRRLSPSLSCLKRNPASDQVTGRGLSVRSREAGRASLSTAVLRSLSVSALPALFCPVEGYKERDRRHEIKTEHESDGGSRGTRAAEPDYGLVQTRILLSPDWIRSSADVRTGFYPPKSVETGGRGADFVAQDCRGLGGDHG